MIHISSYVIYYISLYIDVDYECSVTISGRWQPKQPIKLFCILIPFTLIYIGEESSSFARESCFLQHLVDPRPVCKLKVVRCGTIEKNQSAPSVSVQLWRPDEDQELFFTNSEIEILNNFCRFLTKFPNFDNKNQGTSLKDIFNIIDHKSYIIYYITYIMYCKLYMIYHVSNITLLIAYRIPYIIFNISYSIFYILYVINPISYIIQLYITHHTSNII